MPLKDPVARKAYKKEYNIKNRDKIRAYKLANKEVIAANDKAWRERNKDKIKADAKAHREENKEQLLAKEREYRAQNRDRLNQRKRELRAGRPPEKRNPEWNKRYIERHPGRKVLKNLRERMRLALKGVYKSGKSFELIGCDYEFFVQHIEKQFKPGMTWDNYGTGKDKWVIDHIIPCAVFDLTKDYQQKACFNWQNLQPLWEWENLAKGDKVEVCPV